MGIQQTLFEFLGMGGGNSPFRASFAFAFSALETSTKIACKNILQASNRLKEQTE